jgi:digeranylgeranylglycerophospholipid reductase
MYDVIVVGGNLAGASAAINCADKGIDVALIERHRKPIDPPHCGEGIADVTGEFLELDKIGCTKNLIDEVKINISDIKRFDFKLTKHKILVIDRYHLEKTLLEKAEKNGVKMFLGENMRDFNLPNDIVLDNQIIKGKVIIDATGIACHIGSIIGINTKLKPDDVGVCIQSRVEGSFKENTIHMWYHKPYAPFGYAWLFPINSKLANIGIGIPGGQKLDMKELLNKFIEFTTDSPFLIKNTFRSCVPSGKPLDKLVKNNVILVGDAARLTDSSLGAGIQNAIFSGSLAGLIAGGYINGKFPSLEEYEIKMKKKLKKLRKIYKNKQKLTTDKKFLKTYRRAFQLLSILNRIGPGFFQNYVGRRIKKDYQIVEKYR